MELATKYLGEVNVDETKFIQFPNGLPGFPDEKEFVILDIPENALFQLLQSTQNADLAFVITNPHYFYEDYQFHLGGDILETLKIKAKEDVAVFAIVTLSEPFSESTMNLRAPLIINRKTLLGKQYILHDHTHSSKTPLTPPVKEAE